MFSGVSSTAFHVKFASLSVNELSSSVNPLGDTVGAATAVTSCDRDVPCTLVTPVTIL